MRLLVVEDEWKMAHLLRRALTEEGYAVDVAHRGGEALELSIENGYDLILLDLMLPDVGGLELCRELRRTGDRAPVIILTAQDDIAVKVEGLDSGADDYLTKPFSLEELLARVRALLRRGPVSSASTLVVGDLQLDPAKHEVKRQGVLIELTPREFALLDYFMRRPGQTLTRGTLIEHVWDLAYEGGSNVVDVYVRYLREKIDRPFRRNTIETIRGIGYRFNQEARSG
jgi:two-component system, OmpR family, response regulator